jgi:hypothetical protein
LAEIAGVQVLGSVEDEHTFSTLSFIISKLRNKLCEHLPTIVGMFSQPSSHYKIFHMMPHSKNGRRPRFANWKLNGVKLDGM